MCLYKHARFVILYQRLNACDKNFTYALDFVISLQCYITFSLVMCALSPIKRDMVQADQGIHTPTWLLSVLSYKPLQQHFELQYTITIYVSTLQS